MITVFNLRGAAVLTLLATMGAPLSQEALAQSPPAQATSCDSAKAVADIVTANAGKPNAIMAALAAAVVANPELAAEVIAYAKCNPAMAELLAQSLSKAQAALAALGNTKAAGLVSQAVASAPAAFQAAYAVALSGGSESNNTQQAASNDGGSSTGAGAGDGGSGSGGSTGGSSTGGFGFGAGSSSGGGGGSLVSPN